MADSHGRRPRHRQIRRDRAPSIRRIRAIAAQDRLVLGRGLFPRPSRGSSEAKRRTISKISFMALRSPLKATLSLHF